VIGGILCAIPLFNLLNCCFCLLNMAGAAIGVSMYLKQNEGEKITNGEAAVSGAISGTIAGVIAGIAGFVMWLALGATLAALMRTMPREAREMLTNRRWPHRHDAAALRGLRRAGRVSVDAVLLQGPPEGLSVRRPPLPLPRRAA
jgi:hypothetical protein